MLKGNNRMKQAYNPYLPLWEYVPDGEPRVFGDRVYLYGSHRAIYLCCQGRGRMDLLNFTLDGKSRGEIAPQSDFSPASLLM